MDLQTGAKPSQASSVSALPGSGCINKVEKFIAMCRRPGNGLTCDA